MARTLGFVLIHVVFSTKDRVPCLGRVQHDLYAWLATAVRTHGCECFRVGGVADHVHLAIRLSRTVAIAPMVADIKATSSKWLKTQRLRAFEWQRGYGLFSVGPADLGALAGYIEAQEVHHARFDFKTEFRALMKRYGLDCDEKYLWE